VEFWLEDFKSDFLLDIAVRLTSGFRSALPKFAGAVLINFWRLRASVNESGLGSPPGCLLIAPVDWLVARCYILGPRVGVIALASIDLIASLPGGNLDLAELAVPILVFGVVA
jgi:hypothetical protein